MSQQNNHINYIEFKSHDLMLTKKFYQVAFEWEFTDYGSNYTSFEGAGIAGGFEKTDSPIINGVLVVLYHTNLLIAKENVIRAGGKIVVDIFSFPGGERFQFTDPSGNELAVWKVVEG